MCVYPDTPVTLVDFGTRVEPMLCACTLTHQLRWLTLVDFGTGVEPMLCVYPDTPVTLAYAGRLWYRG